MGLMSMAQPSTRDSLFIRQLYDSVLVNGNAYADLEYLCKEIGPRLSGSANAARAVEWGKAKMESYGFDKVWLMPVMVPKWERGSDEEGFVYAGADATRLHIAALGGSVGTNGVVKAEVIEAKSIDHLKSLGSQVKGKIVFLNEAMDPARINTFSAYGGCYQIRAYGATEAAKLGAVAVMVRSLTLSLDNYPHTGSLQYQEGVQKIPAAAISTRDAVLIKRLLNTHGKTEVSLSLSCKDHGMVPSFNVIGEISGTSKKDEIIVVGGHLDSWDLGEGAHDDGAGVIHALEALRLLKANGYKPERTLRVVWFMNEENGNFGGKEYAQVAKNNKENHYAAIESDRGGFAPRGFSIDGNTEQLAGLQQFTDVLASYDLHSFEKGYGGVDIGPLRDGKVALIGFVVDSQRYFDHHHAQTDVFESVNKRELELGAAACASLIYLIDRYGLNGTHKQP
jgi:Zn-dependent M28 family amino/carboxypeptidase